MFISFNGVNSHFEYCGMNFEVGVSVFWHS